ncbi:MAG: ribosomal L7Ae/L30e/S12e/Gadd45 family protein [Clostridiales bacterium]|nr:ribosomal L7Ae/L30e/S12e/Gadd45 family protein [Clostridiales bacterium]MBR6483890.1 ribosomal L7Ae/L30e/S12e/Gadd45 family protein [Clostridiales bacterium]
MTGKNDILKIIGLAMRAGRLESGFDGCTKAVLGGKAKMIIISKDISSNTLKKLTEMIERSGRDDIYAYSFGSSFELGRAIGKPDRALIAITDDGFADKLDKMLSEYDETEDDK